MPVEPMSPRNRTIALSVAILLLVALTGVVLYARGGGPLPDWLGGDASVIQDPLAASTPAETVLRTLRLAGFQRVVVGDESGTAMLRVQLPAVNTAADVEIAWQSGIAALSAGYPSASDYIVQVFADDRGLVEIAWEGEAARDAVERDDAEELTGAAGFTYLGPEAGAGEGSSAVEPGVFDFILKGLRGTEKRDLGTPPAEQVAAARELRDARPLRATALPDDAVSIDIEYGAAYLDAKNHAAGLAGGQAMLFRGAGALRESAGFMRGRAPGIPALPPGVDAGQFWAGWGLENLGDDADIPGAAELADEFRNVATGLEGSGLAKVRAATMSAIALARAPFGTVLAGTSASAKSVRTAKLVSSADRNAVLAAARDPRAPESATTLTAMERDESQDVTPGEVEFGAFPVAALPPNLGYVPHYWGDGETQQLNPDVWRAYRRDDGALFWRAGDDGDVAVADASLIGWAYSSVAAAVVDASDVGLVRAYLTVER